MARRRRRGILARIRLAVVAVALGALVLPGAIDGAAGLMRSPDAGGCRIVGIIDGDTVTAWCPGGFGRVRLLGLDAPELYSPRCPSELRRAIAAQWYLRWRHWTARTAALRRDGTDRYGRALGTLILDGRDAADLLIAGGLARPYDGGARAGWCGPS